MKTFFMTVEEYLLVQAWRRFPEPEDSDLKRENIYFYWRNQMNWKNSN